MDIRAYSKILLTYLILLLLQVMVVNNIIMGSWGITPLLYVLYVLVLPFEIPRWVLLVSSFVMGYSVDVFCDTPGLNSGALVAMAFARPWILGLISPRDGYESGTHPYLMEMGRNWFLSYSLPLVFIHHLVYFVLDEFGLGHFLRTMGQTVITTIVTEFFVIISQFIAFRK